DVRCDAGAAVAQMGVAVIRHYMRVLAEDGLAPEAARRRVAQRVFRIVLDDFLPRILDPRVARRLRYPGPGGLRRLVAPGRAAPGAPFLPPIEFSAAVFRFGHSLVRKVYAWNGKFGGSDVGAFLERTGVGGVLPEGRLSEDWAIDWNRMLLRDPERAPNHAAAINFEISDRLMTLEAGFFEGEEGYRPLNLARETLMRARTLALPSAQTLLPQVSEAFDPAWRDTARPLAPDEISAVPDPALRAALLDETGGPSAAERTPLWLYTLAEAVQVHGGQRLGPFASLIVLETLHGAIAHSRHAAGFDFRQSAPGWTLGRFLDFAAGFVPAPERTTTEA
ncbi:MAG: hypothetical protein AAFW69_12400, partial [Pseudomonadota bacterium]